MRTAILILCWLSLAIGCGTRDVADEGNQSKPSAEATTADTDAAEPTTFDRVQWDQQISDWVEAAHAHEAESRFSEAIAIWNQVRVELLKSQSEGHWQVANCGWAIRTDQRLARLTAEEQAQYARLLALDAQALRQSLVGAARSALGLVREAQTIAEQLFGVDAVMPLNIRLKAARLAMQIEDWDVAEVELRACLELGARVRPGPHPDLEQALADLGSVEAKRSNTEAALRCLAEAHRLAHALYGEVDLTTARRANEWGVALHRAQLHEQALRAFAESETIRRRLQANPTLVAECALNAAAVLIDLNRLEDARAKLVGVVEADGQTPLAEAVALEARSKLATVHTMQKRFAEAAELLRSVLEIVVRTAGDLNPRHAEFSYRLGMNLGFLGEFSESESHLRHALAVQTNLLGHDNATTRKSAQALVAVLEKLNRPADAAELAEQYSLASPMPAAQAN